MTMRALWQRWFRRDECVEADVRSLREDRRRARATAKDATLALRMTFKETTGPVAVESVEIEPESVEVLVPDDD